MVARRPSVAKRCAWRAALLTAIVAGCLTAWPASSTAWLGQCTSNPDSSHAQVTQPRRVAAKTLFGGAGAVITALSGNALPAVAKKEQKTKGVNRPELLPTTPGDKTPVIDVAKILSDRQKRDIERDIAEIEKISGVKLRVLAQTYPNSPGLAIKDYWNVDTCTGERPDKTCLGDAKTVVYVHDTGGLGSAVVNFAVGREAELLKPTTFWRQTQNKYGNTFYIQEHGDSETVVDVVAFLKEELALELQKKKTPVIDKTNQAAARE